MEINYSEILFETIGMIAGNYESSVQAIQDEISEEEEITATPVVDPMADIVQMEKLSISNIKITQEQVIKLNKSWNFTKTHDYDLISLEVSITAISEEIIDKSYGIQLILSTNTKQHIVQFDSTEMLGNPYNFIQALQKKSFNLSEIKNLRSIEIRLFNNSNVDVQFDDINLVVGYSFGSYTAAAGSLVLYTDDEKMEYETNAFGELGAGATRNIYARWIYQDENDNYYAITHNNYTDLPLGANVFWYKYSPNATVYDEFGGKNWIRIDSNTFILQNYVFNPEVEQEQFKIVIVNTNQDNGQLSINTSNILTFVNKKENQLEIVRNGVIELNDNSNGIYPYYSWDGYIDDKFGYQTSVVRLMGLTYNSSIEYIELAKKVKEVIWKIPQEHMKFIAENLEIEEDEYKIKGGYRVEQIIEEDTEGYSILTTKVLNASDREIETDGKARTELAELFSTTFGIKGRRISSPWKNDIVCSIILDDNSEYTFSRDVSFNVAGESGSEYSVVVRIKDAAGNVCNAVPIGKSDYSLVMSVYDSNGESVINDCSIEYTSFYSNTTVPLTPIENTKGVYSIKPIGSFNAYGLIFTITLPSGNKLIKYFGIPVCASDINPVNVRYNGPSEIVYNHAGVEPKFNDSNIELIGANGITWLDKIKNENEEEISTLPFGFVLKTEPYQLTVGNSYFKEWTGPEYYLTAKRGTEAEAETVWVQPLLIYQNPYFSSLINEWDNALKIDNDNNVIFSSAYIAGSKGDNNKFTGAILGELGKITDGQKSSETGLFGYQEGTQIFGFKTDGTAFIGPSGGGRILFDGTKGQIYSGNFDGWAKEKFIEDGIEKERLLIGTLNTTRKEDGSIDYGKNGTYIDLDDGILITNNGHFRGHIEAASGQIGGWTIDQHGLFGTWKSGDKTKYAGIRKRLSSMIDIVLFAGGDNENGSDASFIVRANGAVTASNMNISGGQLAIGTVNGQTAFKVDGNGDVTMNGGITLGGSITWGAGSSPTQVVYTQVSNPTKPQDGTQYSQFLPNNNSDWHQTFNSSADKFASYTYDGGQTWGNPIKVVGEDGKDAEGNEIVTIYYLSSNEIVPTNPSKFTWNTQYASITGTWVNKELTADKNYKYVYTCQVMAKIPSDTSKKDQEVTVSNVVSEPELCKVWNKESIGQERYALFWELTNGGKESGLFYSNGQLVINASYINTGVLSADLITGGELKVGDVFNANVTSSTVKIGGFHVGVSSLRNEQVITSAITQYMEDYKSLQNTTSVFKNYYPTEESRSYVYVGTDGIGTCYIQSFGSGGKITSNDLAQTYMARGRLYSNSGTIGGFSLTKDSLTTSYQKSKENVPYSYRNIFRSSPPNNETYKAAFAIGAYLNAQDVYEDENAPFYVTFDGVVGFTSCTIKSDISRTTISSAVPLFIDAPKSHIRIGSNTTSSNQLEGTWSYNNGEGYLKSWRGAKHDIEQLDDRYSTLFDNLNPVRFKYNNGTSGRYHTGLILDELKTAMDTAGIDSQELAAYCVSDPETGEGGIRYGAFIALLVKEVQTLKKELKALKEKKEINNETN